MNLSKLWETVEDAGAWRAAVHEVAKNQIRFRLLDNSNICIYMLYFGMLYMYMHIMSFYYANCFGPCLFHLNICFE